MKKYVILIAVLYLLMACSGGQKGVANFENTFEVGNQDCEKWQLPEVEFSIQYPDNIEVTFPKEDTANDNYISVICKEDEHNFEELTIGWFTGGSNLDFMNMGSQLLAQFESGFKYADPNAKTVFKGKDDFLEADDVYQLQMEYTVADESLGGNPGKYKLFIVLYPNTNSNKNGILLLFQTNADNKTVQNFDDFGVKGLSGKIWSTFKFK